jgi:hypothetical protein
MRGIMGRLKNLKRCVPLTMVGTEAASYVLTEHCVVPIMLHTFARAPTFSHRYESVYVASVYTHINTDRL